MKVFVVKYDGAWMGGEAVVIANNREEAERCVAHDDRTTNFTKVEVEEHELDKPQVITNWDGEY